MHQKMGMRLNLKQISKSISQILYITVKNILTIIVEIEKKTYITIYNYFKLNDKLTVLTDDKSINNDIKIKATNLVGVYSLIW